MIRRHRRTKIIATLGPSSFTPEVLTRLLQGGADVFRLNFRLVRQSGLGSSGAPIVMLTGMRFGQAGGTDDLRVVRVA
jgi:pyruvate kinase